jgi:hypothetical protein
MTFSRTAAIRVGTLAPALETIRRWSTWRQNPPALFDDYLIGLLLLGGVCLLQRDPLRGRILLAAGWGFTCAMAYVSILGQMAANRAGAADPAPIPASWVLAIKIAGGVVAAAGLAATVRDGDQPKLHQTPDSDRRNGPGTR